VLDVVFIVRVEVPDPADRRRTESPLVIPLGKPDSLPTVRLTVPVNPLWATRHSELALWPGMP